MEHLSKNGFVWNHNRCRGWKHSNAGCRFCRMDQMSFDLKSNLPSGPIDKKWEKQKFDLKLINPANKRKYSVIVVGSGLAGASASASLAELGYNVKTFCY